MPGAADIRSIIQPVMRLAFSIEKVADRKLRAEVGLSVAQFRMLMVIRRGKDVRQRDIAVFWGVAEASVSRQIEALRGMGLVAARPDRKDRREHSLSLTPRGLSVIGQALTSMDVELEAAFSAVPARERTMLAKGLQRLLAAFQESCGAPARTQGAKRPKAGLRTR